MEINEYLDIFQHLRNDFSDEIPAERVHSHSQISNYKCRSGFRNSLFMYMGAVSEEDYICSETRILNNSIKNYFSRTGKTRMMTPRDIKIINILLIQTIKDLEGKITFLC